jgi:wyosine [tRNA(Phe)-imidazoG37] synthetase (radical SAM superfamily)
MLQQFLPSFLRTGLKNRFCKSPWTYAEIFSGGGVYVCCPIFTGDKMIGNIFTDTPEQIWNSYTAVAIREGVLNGSYDQCLHNKCPFIVGNSLPTYKAMKDDWLGAEMAEVIKKRQTVAVHGPRVVKLCHDVSCNLWCPSCRSELIVAKKEEQEQLRRVRDEFILPFLKDAYVLVLSGDGDPFGSNHYREIMRMTADTLPQLKIGLHTNAVLLDQRAWDDCRLDGRVKMVQISIDAATPETYAYVRRGGDFHRLMRNLEFLADKRRRGEFSQFDLLYVVQTRNFREIADFVKLGQRLGVNSVRFSLIDHWGRGMSEEQYRQQKIWDPQHPQHAEFVRMLRDPIFRDPIVQMSALDMLLANQQPATAVVGAKGGIKVEAQS